jgi:hypothetical protein
MFRWRGNCRTTSEKDELHSHAKCKSLQFLGAKIHPCVTKRYSESYRAEATTVFDKLSLYCDEEQRLAYQEVPTVEVSL